MKKKGEQCLVGYYTVFAAWDVAISIPVEGSSFYPVQNGKHFLERSKGRNREICPQVHGKLGQMPSYCWQEVP